MTLIIAPHDDSIDRENEKMMRSGGFNPKKDANIKIDLLAVAQRLHDSVDMTEHEFRLLLSKVFESVPQYHIKQIVRTVKKGGKLGRFESLSHKIRDV